MNWSDGEIKSITASCAGNTSTSKSPGIYKKWMILYGYVKLVTDANVGNRLITTKIQDTGATVTYMMHVGDTIVASKTGYLQFVPFGNNNGGGFSQSGDINDEIFGNSANFIIAGTDKIVFSVANGVAGDALTAAFKVIELPL